MNSSEVRQKFFDFFASKGHTIVASAPIVVKNDPTLMFTNAGMNQFKDIFLGNGIAENKRVANTQKCLRVSGKHNDLEEVGIDTYHHTMFEMLGNWSFGDYFKKDAIKWAWELLTEVYKLDKNRLYVTVFEGNKLENLDFDNESFEYWAQLIDNKRILNGNKKDNFWEMGDTGPCGPCSEIHYDLRADEDRFEINGSLLVNKDHPQVIEIWNLVFMQYNRKADGSLELLPDKHVDTGMGLERLVRCINNNWSNYDTDIFQDTIAELENISKIRYTESEKTDIAFRVIADHIRAISFAIADGQLPSNNGAGYVIRRILRRAIRYGYSSLEFRKPEIYKIVEPLALKFKNVFPELLQQADFVSKVVFEEEKTFLNTLTRGLEILNDLVAKSKDKTISGVCAFELYDTYGFPLDLTKLIASDFGFNVDEAGFETELIKQKSRSRKDAEKSTGDWTEVTENENQEFIGYDNFEAEIKICRYRTVNTKGNKIFQVVFDKTPFYAEGGGQVGDTGTLIGVSDNEIIKILDTKKENNLAVHILEKIPVDTKQTFKAVIDKKRRQNITRNHSATHLLNGALKQVLGSHVSQKGSLVESDRLRFDFSHISKISKKELNEIEKIVNSKIRENIQLDEKLNLPIDLARKMGAVAVFGEKYGDFVRVITFDPLFSMELCGGTHVKNTSEIGAFKIISESSIAAGVRRIEAISGNFADEYISKKLEMVEIINDSLSNPPDLLKAISELINENYTLKKRLEKLETNDLLNLKNKLITKIQTINSVNTIIENIELNGVDKLKDLCFQLKNEVKNIFAVFTCLINEKPMIAIIISDNLVSQFNWNAGNIIKLLAKEIDGGGGGQAFFATAGGKNQLGMSNVLKLAKEFVSSNS
ncbi:MAG: alanine--tRNA ligase [Bacteroidetes bacterium]|nr:alanine--tRNA ligase [Bacteroidota bacterium]